MPVHELSEVPLLSEARHSSPPSPSSEDPGTDIPETTRHRLVITLVVVLLAFEIGGQLIPGPMVRVIETISCDRYWHLHDGLSSHIPEHLCNIPAVQAEVAIVKGYSDLFEGLLCAICAIPYGLLADRYGRRRAIRLTVPGFMLNALITNSVLWFSNTFPLRGIWLASFSWIIGGGPAVALVIIWTMLADLTADSQRAMLFFRVGLASQVAGFLASAISSGLLALNPWISLMIGCGIVTVGLGCAFSLPETMNLAVKTQDSSDEPVSRPLKLSPRSTLARKIQRLANPYLFVFTCRLILLLFSFAIFQLAQGSSAFLTQYISTRYTWTLARAQLLTSLHAAATIPVFLLLPHFSKKVLHYLSLPKRDLQVARFSILSLAVGSLCVGLSPYIYFLVPSLCLHALGAGFALAMQSLMTSLVKREETARLYSVIEILKSMGSVLGSLCFTNAFKSGLMISGIGTGVVWVLSSLLFALVGITLMVVRV